MPAQPNLVAEAVDTVVFIARTLAGRRLGQFVKVAGCDPATGYRLETLTPDTKEKFDACKHSADRG